MLGKTFIRLMAATALCVMPFLAFTSQAQTTQQYTVIDPPLPSDTPGKIEVLEFFTYICVHCFAMEPLVEDWAKTVPADVLFKKVPVAFNASMKPLQQLYYTLLALNRPDLHTKAFAAIHKEGKQLFTKAAIGDWIAAQGVDRAKFDSVFNSFSVNAQVQRADQLSKAYRVDGTPYFAVGGKYITSPVLAGQSYEGTLKEVNQLLTMIRGG